MRVSAADLDPVAQLHPWLGVRTVVQWRSVSVVDDEQALLALHGGLLEALSAKQARVLGLRAITPRALAPVVAQCTSNGCPGRSGSPFASVTQQLEVGTGLDVAAAQMGRRLEHQVAIDHDALHDPA